jgi:hypothetical protein
MAHVKGMKFARHGSSTAFWSHCMTELQQTRPAIRIEPFGSTANGKARSKARHGAFLRWLRATHGWIGLWGASLGLLFGSTGILLNHRALLKIPAAQTIESNLQLSLPDPPPTSAAALSDWLQRELAIDRPAGRVRSEPARAVAWADPAVNRNLQQPARWSAVFTTPDANIQVEYWVGNSFVSVKRGDNNVFATLGNLHKGTGMNVGWILLVDTLAGSIILLSLSGLVLWMSGNRRRLVGVAISLASLSLVIALVVQAM